MYKPLIDGYFRGDQIYGSAYSKSGLITFITNTGFQNKRDRTHFGPSLDFLSDEFQVQVFRRDSAANVLSSKPNSQYYQLDSETYKSDNVNKLINRKPIITNSIKVTWEPGFKNRAQFSFKTGFLSTRGAYDYVVDSANLLFDWDVAQGASELSGKALIYHKDSLSIFGSTLQDSVYDNPSNKSFTSMTEICFSEMFHEKNKLNTAYIKNGDFVNSVTLSSGRVDIQNKSLGHLELYEHIADGNRWSLSRAMISRNRLFINDSKYRIYEQEEFFYEGQLSSDYVKNILFDGEAIWIQSNETTEKLVGSKFVKSDTEKLTQKRFKHPDFVVRDNSIYEIYEGEESKLSSFKLVPLLYELGNSIWFVDIKDNESPVRWLRMGQKWREKRLVK